MKTCSKCNIEKSLNDFHKKKTTKDGRYSHCKKCQNNYGRLHYVANKIYYKTKARQWRKENPGADYNLSKNEYDKLFGKFNGLCWICKAKKATNVDHDHRCCNKTKSCGKCVRGALCAPCNSGIGMMKDNVLYLNNAIMYLNSALVYPLATNEVKG